MRVLIDVVHPAHVLFFRRPAEMLIARGDEVQFVSRNKDITCELLDEFGFAHQTISTAGRGIIGLAVELIKRDWAMMFCVRRFRPDVMIGFGGVAISHIGYVTRIPSISFYDHENAKLQTRITWPFISQLFVPKSYFGPTPVGRTTYLAGTKALSYLHPDGFLPDRDRAIECGLEPDCDNFFVRAVSWQANHDLGKTGWSHETLRSVVAKLGSIGRVHLSSEGLLPAEFEPLRYRGSFSNVHHLVAHCRLLVGESATMATEAALLGVPAIYCGHDFSGYILEFEQEGLVRNIRPNEINSLPETIDAALSESIIAARDRYVANRPDWAKAVIKALDDAVIDRISQ